MLTPFQAAAQLAGQAQSFLGGTKLDDRAKGATLTILGTVIPCTHSPVVNDFVMELNGRSASSFVEQCEFFASDVPANVLNSNPPKALILQKTVKCVLKLNPALPGIRMQLWSGGLLPGGLMYQFMLVAGDYRP